MSKTDITKEWKKDKISISIMKKEVYLLLKLMKADFKDLNESTFEQRSNSQVADYFAIKTIYPKLIRLFEMSHEMEHSKIIKLPLMEIIWLNNYVYRLVFENENDQNTQFYLWQKLEPIASLPIRVKMSISIDITEM